MMKSFSMQLIVKQTNSFTNSPTNNTNSQNAGLGPASEQPLLKTILKKESSLFVVQFCEMCSINKIGTTFICSHAAIRQ